MRKDLQNKEGGARKIEVIYLVIWSQMLYMSQKEKKRKQHQRKVDPRA